MTGHDPYFVKKGRVDEDMHIRAVDSSLRILHNPVDVYGNLSSDDNAITDPFTYPAPSEYVDGDDLITGYYHTGDVVGLVDSALPSPSENAATPLSTAGDITNDVKLDVQAAQSTLTSNALPQKQTDSAQASSRNSTGQLRSIYSQDLPFASPYARQQGQYPIPLRSIAPHTGATIHDLPATYSSYATGQLLASLPAASSQGATPPIGLSTGYTTGSLLASLPTSSAQVTTPPAGLPTNFTGTTYDPPATHSSYNIGPLLASLAAASSQGATPPIGPSTNFTGPAQTYTFPYRTNNSPIYYTGLPTLTLPKGPKVGQSVPLTLHPIIDALEKLPKIGHTGHPERKILKKPYDGAYHTAPRSAQLIRDHFASGSGLLKVDSPLRDWYGDVRVFEERMWEFLAVQKARPTGR